MAKRVVITSMGICSSLGFDPETVILNLKTERVVFRRAPFDHDVVISPIDDFDLRKITGPFKYLRYLNRGNQFCVASALEAARGARIDKNTVANAGLFLGAGPNLDIGGEFPEISNGAMDREDLMALWILRFLPNTAASVIGITLGIHGENLTLGNACAASLQAIGEAYRRIRDQYLEVAVAGGGDSRISPGGVLAYSKAHALFKGPGDPEKASRPFDDSRAGFIPGEGGACFVLEELTHARNRNAKIYGEICGYGVSLDGRNMTAPEPNGIWAESAVRNALAEAAVAPGDIDAVFAHGTATPLNDAMEAGMIQRVFAAHRPIVFAPKSWIGHTASACGAVELAICLACLNKGYLPGIRNLKKPCHEGIDFVKRGGAHSFGTVLLESFGFGGQNGALVIRKWKS